MSGSAERFGMRSGAARLTHASTRAVRRIRLDSDARGLRDYTRWGHYAMTLAPVLTAWSLTNALYPYADAATLAAIVVVGALTVCFAFLTVHTAQPLLPPRSHAPAARLRRLAVAGLSGVSVAWVVVAFTGIGDAAARFGRDVTVAVPAQVIVVAGAYLCAVLAITVRVRRLWPVAAVVGVLAFVAQAGGSGTHRPGAVALVGVVVPLVLAAVVNGETWYLRVAMQLDDKRETEARLAVAEERLRFSRDLHDVVGQSLSAIAIKSEIGAELARRGDRRAAEVMSEVRALAQESLREARGVVSGYRRADLATEIVGARSLLASVGTTTTILGNPAAVPAALQDTLAWVAREAVTNVVRHASATRCAIAVGTDVRGVFLRITNDGVHVGSAENPGTGLTGLRERLAAVGGTLAADRDGAGFVLEARAPHRAGEPGGDMAGPAALTGGS